MTTVRYIDVVSAARETVAKMLSQRTGTNIWDIEITTNGGKTAAAYRSGNAMQVHLPSFAPDTFLSRGEADRLVAYIAHEVCHLLHTDFAAWQRVVADGARVRSWTNALEDVRIEQHEITVGPYGGIKSLIAGLASHLYAEARTSLADQGKRLGDSFINGPYIATILGRVQNGYDMPTAHTLASELSPALRTVMARALQGVKVCQSTDDCHALARELVKLEGEIKAQQPQQQAQPQQPQQGQGDGQGQGTGDDAGDDAGEADEGQGQGTAGDDAKDSEAEDGGAGAPAGKTGDNDAKGTGNGGEEAEAPETEIDPDLNLGKTPETIADRAPVSDDYRDRSHHLNTLSINRRRMKRNPAQDAQARRWLEEQLPACGVLHGQISRLLVSEARTTRTHHETSGRLDRRAIVRMRTGAPDVFSRRDMAPAVDTAVTLLVDCSASMNGTSILLAQKTAWILAKAIEAAAGKFAIVGFGGGGTTVSLRTVKDFDDHVSPDAITNLKASSNTPMSAAIMGAADDLVNVPATRRILMVLTDGQCDLGPGAVKTACRYASTLDVETVGIGMQAPQVIKAFPERYSINVNDLNELASTGLGTLARMLEDQEGRRH